MKILIKELAKSQGPQWQVRLDQHAVTFRSEAEARAFAHTLETRLQAPHRFPDRQQHAAG
jgi:putative alpha-1,2-mannosidase